MRHHFPPVQIIVPEDKEPEIKNLTIKFFASGKEFGTNISRTKECGRNEKSGNFPTYKIALKNKELEPNNLVTLFRGIRTAFFKIELINTRKSKQFMSVFLFLT